MEKSNRYVRDDAIYNPIEGKWEKRSRRTVKSTATLEEDHRDQLGQWAKEKAGHLRDSVGDLKTPFVQSQAHAEKESKQTELWTEEKFHLGKNGTLLQKFQSIAEEQAERDKEFRQEDEDEERMENSSDDEESEEADKFKIIFQILACIMALIALFSN